MRPSPGGDHQRDPVRTNFWLAQFGLVQARINGLAKRLPGEETRPSSSTDTAR